MMTLKKTALSFVLGVLIVVIAHGCTANEDDANDVDAEARRQMLLVDGQEPPQPDVDLYYAAGRGMTVEVKAHLYWGTDPNEHAADGFTPMHTAARMGDVEVLRLLLAHGADVNITTSNAAGDVHQNITPLHWAARAGHFDAVELLLDLGADPNVVGGARARMPLDFAVNGNHAEIVQLLLQHGARRASEDPQ